MLVARPPIRNSCHVGSNRLRGVSAGVAAAAGACAAGVDGFGDAGVCEPAVACVAGDNDGAVDDNESGGVVVGWEGAAWARAARGTAAPSPANITISTRRRMSGLRTSA